MTDPKSVAIIGAGIFGLSLAIALRDRNYDVTVFDRSQYDANGYDPTADDVQAASADHNKIFRASYGKEIQYQRLALESRKAWVLEDERRGSTEQDNGRDVGLFVNSGMLRIQPSDLLATLEKETLANMEYDGLRDTQFVKSDPADCERADKLGWKDKILSFHIPNSAESTYEAVLDSLAGFMRCSNACAHYQKVAVDKGVKFCFGLEGAVDYLVKVESKLEPSKEKVTGLKTQDGVVHHADSVVVAGILPELSYHLESSAGSLATFMIDKSNAELWDKYSPERFPVMTWKSTPRDISGNDTGSIYVLPRTPDGLVKIGYRGIKWTNFQPAPQDTPFTQDGQWSVPLPVEECSLLPEPALYAIKQFVSVFLPEFQNTPFFSTKLCWYTDSLDNSFVASTKFFPPLNISADMLLNQIDHVPTYAEKSVFVCTGGSGHGAKFLPVLGKHAADIFENGDQSSSFMRPFWRWRPDAPRRNGLEEGPGGPRDISHN
ncbi:FAD dependent oxidoreductase [Penicillium robsamsonii]|uniref:FAD dependent oxidoreductase n=1 Tax=Penicillium robsamsonii TaxID=1792511 RepID=UPI0025470C3F|nr:FAD dependent oxidoreductase [Penicillium robsamsonii]KAJ5822420.1 FAD dependent oxidoreductase [Penicillium robsamsonii]